MPKGTATAGSTWLCATRVALKQGKTPVLTSVPYFTQISFHTDIRVGGTRLTEDR
jgi:hypothetical protein